MAKDLRTTTPRSELQQVGRDLDDLPRPRAAWSGGFQALPPWIWAAVGLLVALAYVGALLIGGPAGPLAAPKQSVVSEKLIVRH